MIDLLSLKIPLRYEYWCEPHWQVSTQTGQNEVFLHFQKMGFSVESASNAHTKPSYPTV